MKKITVKEKVDVLRRLAGKSGLPPKDRKSLDKIVDKFEKEQKKAKKK
jgi:hypothetical protein